MDGFIVSKAMASHVESGRGVVEDMPGALIGSDHRMVYLDLMTDSGQANIGKPLMDVNKRE